MKGRSYKDETDRKRRGVRKTQMSDFMPILATGGTDLLMLMVHALCNHW